MACACAGLLLVAAWIDPDRRGYGTHEALGMPPCGFLVRTRLPCPTCGMTTAYTLLMHGRIDTAFLAQPAGALLCLGTAACALIFGRAAIIGRLPSINWDRIRPVLLMMLVVLTLLLGWGFKLALGLATGSLPVR